MSAEHWLVFDNERRITGCHCGFAAEEGDEGYGDSVVAHLLAETRALLDVVTDDEGCSIGPIGNGPAETCWVHEIDLDNPGDTCPVEKARQLLGRGLEVDADA